MTLLPGVAELREQFRTFRYSMFRLETLDAYEGSSEDPARAAFARGDRYPPPDPDQDRWVGRVRVNSQAGRTQQRVHVVREPVSESGYLAFELTWEYGPHAGAGEDIRIIPVTTMWPVDVPHEDFWLFDSQRLFRLDYDDTGMWLGAERVNDSTAVAHACFVRDAAWHQSMPWTRYLASHPELAQRLPEGV